MFAPEAAVSETIVRQPLPPPPPPPPPPLRYTHAAGRYKLQPAAGVLEEKEESPSGTVDSQNPHRSQ